MFVHKGASIFTATRKSGTIPPDIFRRRRAGRGGMGTPGASPLRTEQRWNVSGSGIELSAPGPYVLKMGYTRMTAFPARERESGMETGTSTSESHECNISGKIQKMQKCGRAP